MAARAASEQAHLTSTAQAPKRRARRVRRCQAESPAAAGGAAPVAGGTTAPPGAASGRPAGEFAAAASAKAPDGPTTT